jgi:hypothetical protein
MLGSLTWTRMVDSIVSIGNILSECGVTVLVYPTGSGSGCIINFGISGIGLAFVRLEWAKLKVLISSVIGKVPFSRRFVSFRQRRRHVLIKVNENLKSHFLHLYSIAFRFSLI